MIDFIENGIKPDTDTRYYKVERYNEEATAGIQTAIGSILQHLGEDTSRDGIVQTPMRVAKALQFCTQGYQTDPKKMLEGALFHENYSQMVLVKDIELYSLCEHHLLPFFGKRTLPTLPSTERRI